MSRPTSLYIKPFTKLDGFGKNKFESGCWKPGRTSFRSGYEDPVIQGRRRSRTIDPGSKETLYQGKKGIIRVMKGST